MMSTRKPFSLRRPLVLWNIGLAIFSIFGTLSLLPSFVNCLYTYGLVYSICDSKVQNDPHQILWGFFFVLSKILEFGDTAFIILRKKPLLFLHWYHHVTVCIYSFYIPSGMSPEISRWFGTMNYVVHSIMYSYYALRALGYRIPSRISLYITVMQLSQMFVGIFINVVAYKLYLESGSECGMEPWYFYVGMCIYGSYAILFLHFFISRYVLSPKAKME